MVASVLLPDQNDDRVSNGHRLIWSLFADASEQRPRDFLWRLDTNGWFYILSTRAPPANHLLLEIDEPKVFAPALNTGDRLRFSLRANPTVSQPLDGFRTQRRDPCLKPSRKTAHHDIVMHAIHQLPEHGRADARRRAIQTAGRAWLTGQGARCGFALPEAPDDGDVPCAPDALRVDGYQVLRPPRPRKAGQMHIGVLDFDGVLTVTNPPRFLEALATGFGRAKAYGCGLMLIARA
jgi:CRISPR system Cascade subunit CasE